MSFTEDTGFNGQVFKCIDRALGSLGEGVRESLYFQIKEKYNLPKEELVTKPLQIIEHLDQILGNTGSSFVERLIIKEIEQSFGLRIQNGITLKAIIEDARKKFLGVR